MRLPKNVGDSQPVPHRIKAGPANIKCDVCDSSILIKLHIEKVSRSRYMDFFTCPKCRTRYNVSVVTEKGIELRERMSILAQRGKVGTREFNEIRRRYASMITEPEARIVTADG